MWRLKHVKKDHIENYIFVGEDFIVGRKDASLLITNDPSVSRQHAVLFVKHPEENLGNPSKKSSLFLRDEKSKYGTFKNGLRVSSEVELVDGDVVKFGQFESEFRIHMQPLVVTTSCLELPAKRELKKTVHMLGGSLISEWQPSCSHLVMPEVKVTVKALCCLVSCKPIVKPEYFRELKKSLQHTSSIISPNQFIPPIGEALIDKDQVSFDINPNRKNLFENKTFFFLEEKQFKKLHLGIILGGGNASILTKDTADLQILLGDGVCVIEPTRELISSQGVKDILPQISSTLQKKELRLIPESDIGLAVAYCSTEKFCNPRFALNDSVRTQRIQSQSLTQREVYVPDTEQQVKSNTQKPMNTGEALFSSLHISTVNQDVAEDMEVSEMPLSAQVKQELDDLFGDIVENETNPTSKIDPPPIAPQDPPSRRSKRLTAKKPNEKSPVQEVHSPGENDRVGTQEVKPEIMENSPPKPIKRFCNGINSPAHDMKKNSSVENDRVKKPKVKREIIQHSSPERISLNGRSTPIEDTKDEIELPRNLMKVEYVSLIGRKPSPVVQLYKNSSVKNFKKFKKVYPKRTQVLPRIIGAHELVPHDKIASATAIFNDVWGDPDEEVMPQPVRGEFDWDTPTV